MPWLSPSSSLKESRQRKIAYTLLDRQLFDTISFVIGLVALSIKNDELSLQGFDRQCRAEVGFFVSKTIINVSVLWSSVVKCAPCHYLINDGHLVPPPIFCCPQLFAIGAVVRLYRQLKNGVSWKPADVYEL